MSDKLPDSLRLNGLPYSNKDLFANHYLKAKIHEEPESHLRDRAHLQLVLDQLVALYEAWRPRIDGQPNEAATEEDFIHKVLAILWNDAEGHTTMDVQVKLKVRDSIVKLDAALFPDADSRERAVRRPAYWENHAVVVEEAKRWGANLDKKSIDEAPLLGGKRRQESPSAQLTGYLLHSDVRWGILTNGSHWRLYERDRSRRASPYFEVNLQALLEHPDVERFWWFYVFFSRTSFIPNEFSRPPFVERVLEGSLHYARGLGESIKENVNDALEVLIQGLFNYPANRLDPSSREHRIQAKEAALIILYRLLFISFAEAKPGLLPMANAAYKPISLYGLQERVHKELREHTPQAPGSLAYWGLIRELWRAIDEGMPLGGEPPMIPEYDGGLFGLEKWPEIAHRNPTWQVGNDTLAEVLDLLAYPRKDWDVTETDRADYSALGVRELGSIYESLLEQHPVLADAVLAADLSNPGGKKKGASSKRRPVAPGQVCLVNDKGERKSTGSYYTPDWVVEYIVDETLGPLLDERISRLEQSLDGLHHQLAGLEKQFRGKPPQQRAQLPEELQRATADFLAPIARELKVVDPAMGSGHFLVAAADLIARRLASVEDMISIFELAGLLPEGEIPLDYFRRFAVEHCLYGVDLNPLAVELAKLSLWLHTVSGGHALSFLDHRLRCGNSLIGTRVDENLRYAPRPTNRAGQRKWDEQMSQPEHLRKPLLHGVVAADDILRFVSDVQRIEAITGGSAEDQHEKRDIYRQMDEGRQRYRVLADAWFAPFYEIEVPEAEYSHAFASVNSDEQWQEVTGLPWYGQARTLFEKKRVFHWELEFPEVFFEPYQTEPGATPIARRKQEEACGFDAVVGNPPYVRQEGLGQDKPLFSYLWHGVYDSIADLYVYFYAAGLRLLNLRGRFGMITSNKFIRSNYGRELRKHLRKAAQLETVVDFGELRVFGKEASPDACILVLSKQKVYSAFDPEKPAAPEFEAVSYLQVKDDQFKQLVSGERKLASVVAELRNELDESAFIGTNWSFGSADDVSLLRKLEVNGQSLRDYLAERGITIRRGILTGFNKAFVLDRAQRDELIAKDASSSQLIKPLLAGDDVRRYYAHFRERYMILTKIGVPIQDYPAVFEHLQSFESKLRIRADQGKHWWELRSCDYYSDFEQPKIIYPDIAMSPRFFLDKQCHYIDTTCFHIATEAWPLLAVLNSGAANKLLMNMSPVLGDAGAGGRFRAKLVYMNRLALPKGLDSTTQRPKLDELAQKMTFLQTQRQVEERRFLKWLSIELDGQDLNQLSGKTSVLGYGGSLQPEGWAKHILPVLKRNSRRYKSVDVKTSQFQNLLEAEYEQSRATLVPILDKLAGTDKAINEIVYQLYDLTEAEIALISRSGLPADT